MIHHKNSEPQDNDNDCDGQGKPIKDFKVGIDLGPITGESIMKSDYPLVPLVPPTDFGAVKDSKYYTAQYLKMFIGKCIRVQMQLGCNCQLFDRAGVLVEIGQGFIVLETLWHDYLMCDLDLIKLVIIYR